MRDTTKLKNTVKTDALEKATPVKLEEIVVRLNRFSEATVVDVRSEDHDPLNPKDGLWVASTEVFVAPKEPKQNMHTFSVFTEKVKKAIEAPENRDITKVIAVREDKVRLIPREEVADYSTLELPALYYIESVCSDKAEHHLKFPDSESAQNFFFSFIKHNSKSEAPLTIYKSEILIKPPEQPLLESIIVRIYPDLKAATAAALGKLSNVGHLGESEAEDIKSVFRF
ncbi:MAG: hypothetical protein ABSD68_00075 [Candidatus Micrarchaeales archaeon]|jgi:hypothetical protein